MGCNGGYPTRAPKFYEKIGHVKMANYPDKYLARKQMECKIDRTKVDFKNKDTIVH